jgi:hypothetical protein
VQFALFLLDRVRKLPANLFLVPCRHAPKNSLSHVAWVAVAYVPISLCACLGCVSCVRASSAHGCTEVLAVSCEGRSPATIPSLCLPRLRVMVACAHLLCSRPLRYVIVYCDGLRISVLASEHGHTSIPAFLLTFLPVVQHNCILCLTAFPSIQSCIIPFFSSTILPSLLPSLLPFLFFFLDFFLPFILCPLLHCILASLHPCILPPLLSSMLLSVHPSFHSSIVHLSIVHLSILP